MSETDEYSQQVDHAVPRAIAPQKHLNIFTHCEIILIKRKRIEMISTTEEMTNFTFKIDKKTREGYSALCEALGLSMSAATLALIRQAVRSQSMTFSLRDSNGFTLDEAAELKRRIEDIEKGKVFQHNIIED